MKMNIILMISLLSLSIVSCNNGATSTASSSNSTTSSPEGVTGTMSETVASSSKNTTSFSPQIAFIFNAPGNKVYNVVLYDYDYDKEKQGKLKTQDVGSNKIYTGTWQYLNNGYYTFTFDGKTYWYHRNSYDYSSYVYSSLDDAKLKLSSDRIGLVHDNKQGEDAIILAKKWGF